MSFGFVVYGGGSGKQSCAGVRHPAGDVHRDRARQKASGPRLWLAALQGDRSGSGVAIPRVQVGKARQRGSSSGEAA